MLVAVLQSHATRHLSQAYKAYRGRGNEVNLIRQATRFRALVNRETLLGQVPSRSSTRRFYTKRQFKLRDKRNGLSLLPANDEKE